MTAAATAAATNPIVARIDAALDRFLSDMGPSLAAAGPDLRAVSDAARELIFAGGKRMRPLFAYWGWRCLHHEGADGEDALILAAASLELLHASALVHDDLIDDSDTRRGHPAAHHRFAHLVEGSDDTRSRFGAAAAILLGDLLLSWSAAMLASAGLDAGAARAAQATLAVMSSEMMAGQYLDVLEQTRRGHSVTAALRVARFKSSKYTVERPLLLGAIAGGAPPELLRYLSDFGLPLGEAFQLRDDVLGVFGDPVRTGKPAGDDLREGKRTVLVALAHAGATPAQRTVIDELLGAPDIDANGIGTLRALIVATGALGEVEQLIDERWSAAQSALDQAVIRPDARDALAALGEAAVSRAH